MSNAISPSWNRDTQQYLARHKTGLKDEPFVVRSPLLFDMFKRLSQTEALSVFDIAGARQSSIDFFSDYRCRLFIADAVQALAGRDRESDSADLDMQEVLTSAIPFDPGQPAPLDMILLWTLPNYLTPVQLKALVQFMLPHAARRVKLHAYIYNSANMPAEPVSCAIRPEQKLAMHFASASQRPCPLYHLAALHDVFAPLTVEHSVILSSGIQEYVFSR